MMSLDIGIDKMTQYLRGEIRGEELDLVISWIAVNSGLSVKAGNQCFHRNPRSLKRQLRYYLWIGSSE